LLRHPGRSPGRRPFDGFWLGAYDPSGVAPSGEAVEVATGTLPVSSTALPASSLLWSQPIEIPAATKVAPALGVLTLESAAAAGAAPAPTNVLFLAWTTADATIEFARLNGATGQWAPSDPPVVLPTGSLTVFPAAFGGFNESVNGECIRSSGLGATLVKKPHRDVFSSVHTPCP
jgi:hypothetical protein